MDEKNIIQFGRFVSDRVHYQLNDRYLVGLSKSIKEKSMKEEKVIKKGKRDISRRHIKNFLAIVRIARNCVRDCVKIG